jgi:hypothetical protein
MNRTVIGMAVAALLVSTTAVARAQTGSSSDGKKGAGTAVAKAKPNDEALRAILAETAGAIQLAEQEAKKEGPFANTSFALSRLAPVKAATLEAIGRAQAKVGDVAAARKTWQSAIDTAVDALSTPGYSVGDERLTIVALIAQIARAQSQAGDRDEALDSLRQAARAARLIRADANKDDELITVPFEVDPAEQKADVLRLVAETQEKIGDHGAAKKTFDSAIEAASAIQNDVLRAAFLVELAESQQPADAGPTWARVQKLAASLTDEFAKARATEVFVRGRVRSGDDTIWTAIRNEFKGDLSAYALWAAADELANGEATPTAKAVKQGLALAEAMKFDRNSKKASVVTALAQAQARLGDGDGAYRTLGMIQPDDANLQFNFIQAKVNLMRDVARGQLKAGAKDLAKDTVQVAIEIVEPYLEEGGAGWFPVGELAELLARVGDVKGALKTAAAIGDKLQRIQILAVIANVQAESGDRPSALKTLDEARTYIKDIPNEVLWDSIDTAYQTRSVARNLKGQLARSFAKQFEHLDANTELATAWQAIAIAQAKAGDPAGAIATLEAFKPKKSGSLASDSRNDALGEIALAQAKAGDFAGAQKSLEARKAANAFLESDADTFVVDVAKMQAEAGDAKGALEWASTKKPSSPRTRLSALQGLAEGIVALKATTGPSGKDAAAPR